MEQYINIAKSEYRKFLSQEENSTGKKWSYSYVYFLEDLKLIYNLLCDNAIKTIPQLLNVCNTYPKVGKNGQAEIYWKLLML